MRRFCLLTIVIAFVASLGLYAQEKDTFQTEPKVKLELVWEKEFSEGIVDVALYEDNLMPRVVITGTDPRWGCKAVYFFDRKGNVLYSRRLKGVVFDKSRKIIDHWAEGGVAGAVISKNGRYVGILEPKKFTEKEAEPIGNVEIIDSAGRTVNRLPCDSWYYWVSPYGDEVIVTTTWVDNWFRSSLTGEGIYLDKTEDPRYSLGNLKVIGWRGSKDVNNLVAVYDPTLKSHYKSFAIPATSYGYTHSNYYLLSLPKVNKFALSLWSDIIKLYNENGELVKIIPYPAGGVIFSSPNNRYLLIPESKISDVGVRIEGGSVLDLKTNEIIFQFEKPEKEKSKYINRSDEPGSFGLMDVTDSGLVVATNIDSLWFIQKDRTLKMELGIKRKTQDEKIVYMKVSSSGDKFCMVTNLRIIIFSISGVKEKK